MNRTRSHAAAVVLAAGLSALTALPAAAITDSAFTYTTPKTGVVAVSNLDFAPYAKTGSGAWKNDKTGDGLSGNGCFTAGLTVPHGAKIASIRYNFRKKAQFYVGSYARDTEDYYFLLATERTGPADKRAGFTKTFDAPPVVDNAKNVLGLTVCLYDPQARFYGARITYTFGNAGD